MAIEHEAVYAAETTHQAAEAAQHAGAEVIPELPNFVLLLSHRMHDNPIVQWLHHWENPIFSAITAVFVLLVFSRLAREKALVPKRGQGLIELFVDAIDGLSRGVIGHGWREHTPLILTLFIYIWFMNLAILVPGMKSATASINITVGLAAVVFFYVQLTAIRKQGALHYLHHLAGEPRDAIGWVLSVIMFPLHVVGEFIKPMSLSLRLCFNIFAEDVLLAVICGLGIFTLVVGTNTLPVILPFQALIVPLILIFSTVQALVFSLLAAVYISLVNTGGHH